MAYIISKEGMDILVDDDKLEELSQYKWRIDIEYAVASHKGKRINMHRYLTNCPKGMAVIHLNHKSLDNRLENLKIVTKKEASEHYHAFYRNRERDADGYLVPVDRSVQRANVDSEGLKKYFDK